MVINGFLHLLALTLLITLAVSSSDPPEFSPSPSPAPQSRSEDSISISPSSPSPSIGSPPAPLPSDLSPSPSPSSSPVPSESSDVSDYLKNEEQKKSSDEGMSGGKKAGVAFGLIAAACLVGFGGVLYKKRRENIRRAQYRYAARMDFM